MAEQEYKWEYCSIKGFEEIVHLTTTDSTTQAAVLKAVKEAYPKSRVKTHSSRPEIVYIERIDGRQFVWAIFMFLCSRGWEPFQVEGDVYGDWGYRLRVRVPKE